MNKSNRSLFIAALLMIGLTAVAMNQLRTHQRLGLPGIKTSPIAGSKRLQIELPDRILNYRSELIPPDEGLSSGLPQDTSFIQKRYLAGPEDTMLYNVVLMGTDRTSIHKPQFCLTGSGWNIDASESFPEKIRIENPHAYDLPVMKLLTTRLLKTTNGEVTIRGLYVYWFVAENQLTASHETRMWRTATFLLGKGELVRWAYVGCFAVCLPGNENQTYSRMKKFISASVPEFQLATGPEVNGQKVMNPSPIKVASGKAVGP